MRGGKNLFRVIPPFLRAILCGIIIRVPSCPFAVGFHRILFTESGFRGSGFRVFRVFRG
jgi:hypothetical protein